LLATCGTAGPSRTRTSIFDVPASVAPGQGDHIVTLRGPLNTAGTISENFLLEYAEAMPGEEVGWGCINGSRLRELINLHTAASDLAQRTPAVAIPQASRLLRTIHWSIQQAITGEATPGAEGRPGDKLLLLVGHDTNLLNVAGALNLNWRLDGRRNDTPPGSALVFEVWKNRLSGAYTVRLFFTCQTLEQMRNTSRLTAKAPPAKAAVSLRMCSRREEGYEISCFAHALESVFSVREPSS
jgi:4-phytase / acid phosphatase